MQRSAPRKRSSNHPHIAPRGDGPSVGCVVRAASSWLVGVLRMVNPLGVLVGQVPSVASMECCCGNNLLATSGSKCRIASRDRTGVQAS